MSPPVTGMTNNRVCVVVGSLEVCSRVVPPATSTMNCNETCYGAGGGGQFVGQAYNVVLIIRMFGGGLWQSYMTRKSFQAPIVSVVSLHSSFNFEIHLF